MFQIKQIVPLDMRGCICHFAEWQINPFISKGTQCSWYGERIYVIYIRHYTITCELTIKRHNSLNNFFLHWKYQISILRHFRLFPWRTDYYFSCIRPLVFARSEGGCFSLVVHLSLCFWVCLPDYSHICVIPLLVSMLFCCESPWWKNKISTWLYWLAKSKVEPPFGFSEQYNALLTLTLVLLNCLWVFFIQLTNEAGIANEK